MSQFLKDFEIPEDEKPLKSLMEPQRCATCEGLLAGFLVEGRVVYACRQCATQTQPSGSSRPR